jgi:hypothetical protein
MKLTEHQRLLLPYDPPLPAMVGGMLPSIPQLWERARLFFGRVIDHIGSTAALSKRWRLTRAEKTTLLGWLEPVEKLARSCLLVRALTFLMMTPEGRRLMRETPKMAMPSPPKPPGQASSNRSTKIPLGGWHTHAPYARYLAEKRKQEEQRAAERAAIDRHDPQNWGGAFRVLHWQFPEPEGEDRAPPQKKLPQWAMLLRMSLDDTPITPAIARPLPKAEKDRQALILARRIEALSRVINDPARAVMRLARFIAKLPREALEPLRDAIAFRRVHWLHGGGDHLAAADHVRRAAGVLCELDTG